MADPTQFAWLLGLIRTPDFVPSEEETYRRRANLERFLHAWNREDDVEEEIFWCKFTALYLPYMLEHYLLLDNQEPLVDFLYKTKWVTECIQRPYFPHLVRTGSNLPRRLLEWVVEKVAGGGSGHAPCRITSPLQTVRELLRLRHALVHAISTFSVPVPNPSSTPSHPPLDDWTTSHLLALLPALKTLHPPTEDFPEEDVTNVRYFIAWIQGGMDLDKGETVIGREGEEEGRVSWKRCEAFCDRQVREEECEEAKRKEGKEKGELMQCGRCKTVRYCSVEHQRAHYKRGHKKVCFAPGWRVGGAGKIEEC